MDSWGRALVSGGTALAAAIFNSTGKNWLGVGVSERGSIGPSRESGLRVAAPWVSRGGLARRAGLSVVVRLMHREPEMLYVNLGTHSWVGGTLPPV